jgi:hypothetical protein
MGGFRGAGRFIRAELLTENCVFGAKGLGRIIGLVGKGLNSPASAAATPSRSRALKLCGGGYRPV